MANIKRRSPVSFKSAPTRVETRGEWTVALQYADEGNGPNLIDLSHRPRWDIQDGALGEIKPLGATVPQMPGECSFGNGILINRMNRTQVSVWNLAAGADEAPGEPGCTETTDGTVFLALIGRQVFSVVEKLSSLDFQDPAKKAPCLIQGPFSHVPCQIVVLDTSEDRPGILLTCSRGYARDMVESILKAGDEFGLKPAGENKFSNWLTQLAL